MSSLPETNRQEKRETELHYYLENRLLASDHMLVSEGFATFVVKWEYERNSAERKEKVVREELKLVSGYHSCMSMYYPRLTVVIMVTICQIYPRSCL